MKKTHLSRILVKHHKRLFVALPLALFYTAAVTMALLVSVGKISLPTISSRPVTQKAPQISVAPVASVSQCADSQTAAAFSTCPSFSLNFASQPNGPLSSDQFNIFNGPPEVNQEAELYTDSTQNLRIDNGSLVLEALSQPEQGFKYTSARVDTKNKEDFQYGKLDIKAELPAGIGTWPAIWLLPTNSIYEDMSPPSDTTRYLNDGEIDIAEAVGTQPNVVYGIAHSLAYPPDGSNRNYYSEVTVPSNNTTYHDYQLEWTPTNLTFLVDGKTFFSISKQPGAGYQSWPYDQPFYLVLNLAMGGTWGGTDRQQFPTDGVDPSALPASMKIQSINYYSYKSQ